MTPQAADHLAESFRGLLLRYRGRSGLTQRELAARIRSNRRTIQDWEAGINYPSAQRLQALITALLGAGGLTLGREPEEAHELWAAALREAPRMHTPFDQLWISRLVADRVAAQPGPDSAVDEIPAVTAVNEAPIERRQDWGEAPDVIGFVGRADELTTIRDWVLKDRC